MHSFRVLQVLVNLATKYRFPYIENICGVEIYFTVINGMFVHRTLVWEDFEESSSYVYTVIVFGLVHVLIYELECRIIVGRILTMLFGTLDAGSLQ